MHAEYLIGACFGVLAYIVYLLAKLAWGSRDAEAITFALMIVSAYLLLVGIAAFEYGRIPL